MGWPSTVNFSKERRVTPALPRPAGGVWAISKAGHIDNPATAHVITSRFISVSGIRAMLQSRFGGLSTVCQTTSGGVTLEAHFLHHGLVSLLKGFQGKAPAPTRPVP